MLERVPFFGFIVFSLVGCAKGDGSAGSTSGAEPGSGGSTATCQTQSKSHSGCCSSHGGYAQCGSGKACYTSGGSLVCADGTLSPTCTQSITMDQDLELSTLGGGELDQLAVSCQ